MKTKIVIGCIIVVCVLLMVPSISAIECNSKLETNKLFLFPKDTVPSTTYKYRTFLMGIISGVDWEPTQSETKKMNIHTIFVVGFEMAEEEVHAALPFFPVIMGRGLASFEYVRSFQGYYNDHWICGTVFHSVRVGVP